MVFIDSTWSGALCFSTVQWLLCFCDICPMKFWTEDACSNQCVGWSCFIVHDGTRLLGMQKSLVWGMGTQQSGWAESPRLCQQVERWVCREIRHLHMFEEAVPDNTTRDGETVCGVSQVDPHCGIWSSLLNTHSVFLLTAFKNQHSASELWLCCPLWGFSCECLAATGQVSFCTTLFLAFWFGFWETTPQQLVWPKMWWNPFWLMKQVVVCWLWVFWCCWHCHLHLSFNEQQVQCSLLNFFGNQTADNLANKQMTEKNDLPCQFWWVAVNNHFETDACFALHQMLIPRRPFPQTRVSCAKFDSQHCPKTASTLQKLFLRGFSCLSLSKDDKKIKERLVFMLRKREFEKPAKTCPHWVLEGALVTMLTLGKKAKLWLGTNLQTPPPFVHPKRRCRILWKQWQHLDPPPCVIKLRPAMKEFFNDGCHKHPSVLCQQGLLLQIAWRCTEMRCVDVSVHSPCELVTQSTSLRVPLFWCPFSASALWLAFALWDTQRSFFALSSIVLVGKLNLCAWQTSPALENICCFSGNSAWVLLVCQLGVAKRCLQFWHHDVLWLQASWSEPNGIRIKMAQILEEKIMWPKSWLRLTSRCFCRQKHLQFQVLFVLLQAIFCHHTMSVIALHFRLPILLCSAQISLELSSMTFATMWVRMGSTTTTAQGEWAGSAMVIGWGHIKKGKSLLVIPVTCMESWDGAWQLNQRQHNNLNWCATIQHCGRKAVKGQCFEKTISRWALRVTACTLWISQCFLLVKIPVAGNLIKRLQRRKRQLSAATWDGGTQPLLKWGFNKKRFKTAIPCFQWQFFWDKVPPGCQAKWQHEMSHASIWNCWCHLHSAETVANLRHHCLTTQNLAFWMEADGHLFGANDCATQKCFRLDPAWRTEIGPIESTRMYY